MSDHVLEFRYSKDGGNTWSNWRPVSMGDIGQYAVRCRFSRLGSARQWVFHTRVASPFKRDMVACVIEASEASS